MDTNLLLITLSTWLLFLAIAMCNAILRNQLYQPYMGELRAHQLSTIIFIFLIMLITLSVFLYLDVELSGIDAFTMGGIWLVLTMIFEFLAGHCIFGVSWNKLLLDYNILKGRIWILVLLVTFIAPYISITIIDSFL